MAAASRAAIVVTDFDGCVTVEDTTSVLAGMSSCHPGRWSDLVAEYGRGWRDTFHRATAGVDAGVMTVLDALDQYEARSLDALEGVLQGISRSDLQSQSLRRDLMRDGAGRVLSRACTTIISAGLSADLIETVSGIPGHRIMCNDLAFDTDAVSTGGFRLRNIVTSVDKLQAFQKVGAGNDCTRVYIGDSLSDFRCLLEADVGIVMCGSHHLSEFVQASGIRVVPIERASPEETTRRLLLARTWHDVDTFLHTFEFQ